MRVTRRNQFENGSTSAETLIPRVAKCPRKLFTQRRQIKVQGFIESYMNDPKKLEACGSDTWFQELLEAVGEPGVVMLENVRHWVEINSDAFYIPSYRYTQIFGKAPKPARNASPEIKRKSRKGRKRGKKAVVSVDAYYDKICKRLHAENAKAPENPTDTSDKSLALMPFVPIPSVPASPVVQAAPLIPELPALPQSPVLQAAPLIPELPALPQSTVLQAAPLIPKLPALSQRPVIPKLPSLPQPPVIPALPQPPAIPALPQPPVTLELPVLPQIPELLQPPVLKVTPTLPALENSLVTESESPRSPTAPGVSNSVSLVGYSCNTQTPININEIAEIHLVTDEEASVLQDNLDKFNVLIVRMDEVARGFEEWRSSLVVLHEPCRIEIIQRFNEIRARFEDMETEHIRRILSNRDFSECDSGLSSCVNSSETVCDALD